MGIKRFFKLTFGAIKDDEWTYEDINTMRQASLICSFIAILLSVLSVLLSE